MKGKSGFFLLLALVAVPLIGASFTVWKTNHGGGELVISGIIEADDVQVGSKIGGRVLKVLAREGQRVEAGEVLVLLEPDELNASLAEALASVRQAEARLAELEAGYRQEEIEQAEAAFQQSQQALEELLSGPRRQEIDLGRAEWLSAQAHYENAEKFFRRMRDLLDQQLIARQDYDNAQTRMEEAEQRRRAARERYDLLLAGPRPETVAQARYRLAAAESRLRQLRRGYRQEELAQARASLEMARARGELLKTQLKETVIQSPVEAVVEVLELEPGDLVGAGKPMATLLCADRLWVRAYLPERRLGHVQPGLEVTVRVDSFPERIFSATVRRVHRQAEFTPRNVQTPEERVLQVFQVEVALNDPDGLLRPGMNADVTIPRRAEHNSRQ